MKYSIQLLTYVLHILCGVGYNAKKVDDKPYVIGTSGDQFIYIGENAVFICFFANLNESNPDSVSIIWTKNNTTVLFINLGNIVIEKPYKFETIIENADWSRDSRESYLEIHDVREEDAGTYECSLRNNLESDESIFYDSRQMKLNVLFPAKSVSSSSVVENVTLEINKYKPIVSVDHTLYYPAPVCKATLKCIVSGVPEPKIVWRIGDDRILNNSSYSIKNHASKNGSIVTELQIILEGHTDNGIYTCFAENEYGTDVQKIKLNRTDQCKSGQSRTFNFVLIKFVCVIFLFLRVLN